MSTQQIFLLTARIVASLSSLLVIGLSFKKRSDPNNTKLKILHGLFTMGTRAPGAVNAKWPNPDEATWVTNVSRTELGLTAVKKILDFGWNNATWEKVSSYLEMVLGAVSMIPPVYAIAKKQDDKTVTAFIGNTCWNVHRMLTPVENSLFVFKGKMVCIFLFGVSQVTLAVREN
jgi:hypothetical protein